MVPKLLHFSDHLEQIFPPCSRITVVLWRIWNRLRRQLLPTASINVLKQWGISFWQANGVWADCRGVRLACEAVKAAAAKLSRQAEPQANQKAKRDTEQALQHLAEAVEALQ